MSTNGNCTCVAGPKSIKEMLTSGVSKEQLIEMVTDQINIVNAELQEEQATADKALEEARAKVIDACLDYSVVLGLLDDTATISDEDYEKLENALLEVEKVVIAQMSAFNNLRSLFSEIDSTTKSDSELPNMFNLFADPKVKADDDIFKKFLSTLQ